MLKRNHRQISERVRLVRAVLEHDTAVQFARELKISRKRLNNIENGYPLSLPVAMRLVDAIPGLTLDWLYYGKANGLTVDLARLIELHRAASKKIGDR